MKLFTEYMTRAEMARATDAGQTGLRDVVDAPRENKISGPNMEFIQAKRKFDKTYGKAAALITRGVLNENVESRICLFHGGNFYSLNANNGNHSLLVRAAIFGKKMPVYIFNKEALSFYWNWWQDVATLNEFLCLYYDPEYPTKMFLSESYLDEQILDVMQNNNTVMHRHYADLIKKVFNKQLDVYYGF